MSSSTSPQHDRMLAQQRAHEPSMEEILSSIRRIIADDSHPTPTRVETPAPMAAPAVELRTESAFRSAAVRESAFREAPRPVAVEPTPLAPNRPANAEPAVAPRADSFEALTARLGGPRVEPPRAPAAVEETFDVGQAVVEAVSEQLAAHPAAEPAPILSRDADAAVAAQFGKLSDALMANNAQRLDEMTRQMLRPLLKSWLDDNLPVLVERLVRAEIERVARGGR